MTKAQQAERLRQMVDTVGKAGQPGEQIQKVISVGMLSKGWDTKTVTPIMGLRASTSQLLCEQVVGRGLRRASYEINPQTGLFGPEYVNIFGVPVTFLPHEGGPDTPPPPTPKTLVQVDPAKAAYEIRWPNVVRIEHIFQPTLTVDWSSLPPLELDAAKTAEIAELAPILEGKPDVTKMRACLQNASGSQARAIGPSTLWMAPLCGRISTPLVQRGDPQTGALGRSRAGFSTKVHVRAEGNRPLLTLALTPGQQHDATMFETLLSQGEVKRPGSGRPKLRPQRIAGDKGYSSRKIRTFARRRGIRITISLGTDAMTVAQKVALVETVWEAFGLSRALAALDLQVDLVLSPQAEGELRGQVCRSAVRAGGNCPQTSRLWHPAHDQGATRPLWA